MPEIIFICLIAIYSLIITRYIPKRYYSFSNIIIACGTLGYGIVAGLGLNQLGFNLSSMKISLLIGLLLAVPVIISISLIASHPKLRSHFSSTPTKQYNMRAFSYEFFFRIPFGTALSEEVIFRSVLLAMLIANHDQVIAVIMASLLFGLWHIFPTLHTVKSHDPLIEMMDDNRKRNLVALATTILATSVAGVIFALLTIKTGSFIAAWIVHSAINGFALLGGYIVVWSQKRQAMRIAS